jgi:hypothetical protein
VIAFPIWIHITTLSNYHILFGGDKYHGRSLWIVLRYPYRYRDIVIVVTKAYGQQPVYTKEQLWSSIFMHFRQQIPSCVIPKIFVLGCSEGFDWSVTVTCSYTRCGFVYSYPINSEHTQGFKRVGCALSTSPEHSLDRPFIRFSTKCHSATFLFSASHPPRFVLSQNTLPEPWGVGDPKLDCDLGWNTAHQALTHMFLERTEIFWTPTQPWLNWMQIQHWQLLQKARKK